jgi:hypothetical protein
MRTLRLASVTILALASIVYAQEPLRGTDGHTTYRVPGVYVLEIPDKPFTAKTSTDWTRTTADGSSVKLHLDANIARDSAGRVYRERRGFVPSGSNVPSPLHEILIYDPVSSIETVCSVAAHHCVAHNFRPRTSFVIAPAGSLANGTRFLTREPLGADTIAGLEVTGTRETLTMNPGVAGNDRPLVSTREFWYSADLENNLAVTRNDPTEGRQVIRLREVSRSEPDPSQFAIPSGFSLEQAPVNSPDQR